MKCLVCDVYPTYWQQQLQLVFLGIFGSYTLASQEQVNSHLELILDERLEKWAVAKFENGYVSL